MRTNMSKVICNIIITSMVVLLTACGGSDGDNSSPGAQLPNRLFTGDWTASNNSSGSIFAFSLENELYAIMEDEDNIGITIQLAVSGASLTGQGYYYGNDIENGFTKTTATVHATGTWADNELSLQITRSDGVIYQVTLSIQSDWDREGSASLEKLSGAYHSDDQTIDFTFSDIGVITGSESFYDCLYSGDVEIPDAAVPIYKVHLNVAQCSTYVGDYTGIAFLTEGSVILMLSNAQAMMGDMLDK